jgi:hypothetical protein
MSAKIGMAFICNTQDTLAIQVNETTITSSPGPTPAPANAEFRAVCPEETGSAYLTPTYLANASSKDSDTRQFLGLLVSSTIVCLPPNKASLLISNLLILPKVKTRIFQLSLSVP